MYANLHIVAIYSREVVNRVPVNETNGLAKAARPGCIRDARCLIKGARWLLLRNRSTLTMSAHRVRLRVLLQANRALTTVSVLKEDLKRLWDYRSPAAALRFWRARRRRALSSRIPALKKFTTLLERHLDGVMGHGQYRINFGVLEGCSRKFKVIARMA